MKDNLEQMGERISEMADRLAEMTRAADVLSARCFGLEGRMTTFEQVSKIQAESRKEMLERILDNQTKAEDASEKRHKSQDERLSTMENRQRFIDLRIASMLGGLGFAAWLIKAGIELLHK